MKRSIVIMAFGGVLLHWNAFGQIGSKATSESFSIEQPPEYPGGHFAYGTFMNDNVNRDLLNSFDSTGVCVVGALVKVDGELVEILVERTFNEKVDNELLRLVNLMPKFTPGIDHQAQPAVNRVHFVLKVPFVEFGTRNQD